MHTNKKKGLPIVATGVTILSLDSLLVRLADTTNWNILFWRGLFMFISLGVISAFRKNNFSLPDKKTLLAGFFSACFFGIGGSCFVTSVTYTKVANSVVIISSAPLFAAIFTRIFGIDKTSPRTWIAILLAMTGVFMVFSGSLGTGNLKGDLVAVGAACLMGGNLTLLRRFGDLDRMVLICGGGLIMGLLSLPLASPLGLPLDSYLVLALMGLAQMPLALVLIAHSTKYLPSPEVSLFLLVETLLGPVWVWIVLGEKVPAFTYFGGGIILASIAGHSWAGIRELNKYYKNTF